MRKELVAILKRYDPLGQRMLWFALIGLLAFAVMAIPAAVLARLQALDVFFLLTLLFILPVALALYTHPTSEGPQSIYLEGTIRLYPLAAILGVISIVFMSPGPVASFLTVPFAVAMTLLYVYGLARFFKRGFASPEELALDFAPVYMVQSAIWFTSYRLGIRPLDVPEIIVPLATVHFANAGFTAMFITGLAGRFVARHRLTVARNLLVFTGAMGLLCPTAIAFGIAYGWETLEIGTAYLMEAGYFVLSVVLLVSVVPRIQRRTPRILTRVAGASLFVAMCLAILYTQRIFDIPRMIHTHGYIMAFMFCSCGLLAWAAMGPVAARHPAKDTGFEQLTAMLAAWAFGLFSGQMLLSNTLVGFWKSQTPAEFVAWFSQNLPLITNVLAPLGVAAGVLTLAALFLGRNTPGRRGWLSLAALCWSLLVAANPLFFDQANARLATPGALDPVGLAAMLERWGSWHGLRVVLGMVGFAATVAALRLRPAEAGEGARPGGSLLWPSVLLWGLFTGTLVLTAVLVETWQRMSPEGFFAWFSANAERTGRLLAPLAGLTGLAAIAALVTNRRGPKIRLLWLGGAVLCWFGILAENFLFFERTNAQLASGVLPAPELAALLAQWKIWHWARLALASSGFLYALLAFWPPAGERAAEASGSVPAVPTGATGPAGEPREQVAIPAEFRSLDDVVDGLARLEAAFRARRDRRGVFATVYATMMREMKRRVDAGDLFRDRAWITRFALALANQYRGALAAWEAGDRASVPECWRIAFEAAAGREELVSQDALLALNAHLNHDHTLGLLHASIDDGRDEKHLDYLGVNEVLHAVTDAVQANVAERHSPGLAVVDALSGPFDELLIRFSMDRVRDAAWDRAVQIADARPAEQAALRTRLADRAAELNRLLLAPTRERPWLLRALRLLEDTARLEHPPGELGWPFIGQTLEFGKDAVGLLYGRFRKHGHVFKIRFLGEPMVCFVGPEAFAFLTDERYFQRAGANPRHWRELMAWESSPLIDGAKRLARKRLLLQAFTREALQDYTSIIETILRGYVARWEGMGRLELVPELRSYSFAVCDALYLGGPREPRPPGATEVMDRCYAGFAALPIKLPFTAYGRALQARDALMNAAAEAVARRRSNPQRDLLERLVGARDAAGDGLSVEEIKMEVLQFFYASYGALFASLSCIPIALAQHPEVARRAREEVLRAVGQGPMTLEALDRMPYLGQVTREVRRFYPLTAATTFAVAKETCEFKGIVIPKGWRAIGCIHATMHDEKIFKDPERFDPDRFSPERAEDRIPNSYVAHGGGPPDGHRCAGEALADMHLKLFAAVLLREYTWELLPQDLTFAPSNGIPVPKDGLQVVLRRAAASAAA